MKNSHKEMLLRHWQAVVRGLYTVDHVLRRHKTDDSDLQERQFDKNTGCPKSKTDSQASVFFLPLRQVAIIVLVFGPVYGAAMGAYAFVVGQRSLVEQIPQMVYSGVKVPLLIMVTISIALPSFFVISTLLGLRNDFRHSLRAIVSAQAGLTVILASLFPITLFVYASLAPFSSSYAIAILFNAAMFGIASVAAQVLLSAYYRELIERNRRHLWMCRMWIFVYAFVGIQVGYVLRPFIGSPSIEPSFLRRESFQNAYVKVFSLVCEVIQGLFISQI